MSSQVVTPLVLIAFNRPALLRQQLGIVRKFFTGPIYVVIDGPRANRLGECEKVEEVVELVKAMKNEYELYINRSSKNLGCYGRIKSGLDWVFSQVERAIILEDDCMPSPQFFDFVAQMLECYADDRRIYSISGTNLFSESASTNENYFFSRYPNSWGWATWSRAWRNFINSQQEWKLIRSSNDFESLFSKKRSFLYWRKYFDLTYSGKIDSWFYRWMLSCWMQNALAIYPPHNLIANLGDDEDATNTRNYRLLNKDISQIDPEWQHPKYLVNNQRFDDFLEDNVYSKNAFARLVWLKQRGWNVLWRHFRGAD